MKTCLQVFGFFLLSFVVLPSAFAAEQRPNMLFLFADDWGRYASILSEADGRGGINDVVRTPNFDRIARSGVLFRNSHVNAPSCTPCRSSLLSGQYFWRTGRGAILQGAVWDSSIPAYPLLLKQAGYHIGKTFKVWSPGTPADAPYGGQQHAYEKAGRRFNQFSQTATKLVADGISVEAAKQVLYDETKANFRAFLADRQAGQPFCYWFGPTNTHRKWIKGSGKALWGIDPNALKGKMPPFWPDVHEVREDLADYLGEAQAVDAAIGLLVDEVRKIGELDNTLIVISGDHGIPGFPHGKCNLYDFGTGVCLAIAGPGVRGGRVVDDFVNLTDLAPTFLEAGGVTVPEVMTGRSLWPVLTSDRQGLVDPQRTFVVTGRERHVEMARAGHLPYPQRSIRTADYRLIINFKPDRYPLGDPYNLDGPNPPTAEELTEITFVTFPDDDAGPTKAWLVGQRHNPQWKPLFDLAYDKRPREELYDLKKDPHQVHNVAADPAYAQVRAELERRLMDELQRTGDPRLVDDGRYFETPPLAGPLPKDVPQPKRKR
ncbi:MAG: sulfatase [Pirellulaceae bacterium]|jgi:arylsulfatase A-like enzyme|nr:sulfatase [Pirellulaceae bacterium]